ERTPPVAPEAKLLVQLQERTEKASRFGISREVFLALKPAEREALRSLGLRVPAGVVVTAEGRNSTGDTGPKLDGTWTGTENEGGRERPISVVFGGGRGTLSYTGGIVVAMPLQRVEQQKGTIRFTAQMGGGTRYYVGRWDGKKISGTIHLEGQESQPPLGTFEISQ